MYAENPITHSEPSTGPATDPTPPITAIETICRESLTVKISPAIHVLARVVGVLTVDDDTQIFSDCIYFAMRKQQRHVGFS